MGGNGGRDATLQRRPDPVLARDGVCRRWGGQSLPGPTFIFFLAQRREQDPPPLPPTECEEPRPPPLRTDARQRGSRAGDCGGSYAHPPVRGQFPARGERHPSAERGGDTRVGWARGDRGRAAAVRGGGGEDWRRAGVAAARRCARVRKWAGGRGGRTAGDGRPHDGGGGGRCGGGAAGRRRGNGRGGDSLAAGAQRRHRLRRGRASCSSRRYGRDAAAATPRGATVLGVGGWRRGVDGPWASRPHRLGARRCQGRGRVRVGGGGTVPACPPLAATWEPVICHRRVWGTRAARIWENVPPGRRGTGVGGRRGAGGGVGATRWGLRVALPVGCCASGVGPHHRRLPHLAESGSARGVDRRHSTMRWGVAASPLRAVVVEVDTSCRGCTAHHPFPITRLNHTNGQWWGEPRPPTATHWAGLLPPSHPIRMASPPGTVRAPARPSVPLRARSGWWQRHATAAAGAQREAHRRGRGVAIRTDASRLLDVRLRRGRVGGRRSTLGRGWRRAGRPGSHPAHRWWGRVPRQTGGARAAARRPAPPRRQRGFLGFCGWVGGRRRRWWRRRGAAPVPRLWLPRGDQQPKVSVDGGRPRAGSVGRRGHGLLADGRHLLSRFKSIPGSNRGSPSTVRRAPDRWPLTAAVVRPRMHGRASKTVQYIRRNVH